MNEKIDVLLSLNLTHLYWTREKVKAVGGAFDAYVIRNKHTGEPITAISELTEGAEMYAELFSQAPEMLADLRRVLMAAKKAKDEKENHSPRNQLESI